MNKALQQVGGSYLLCRLSRDGTAVTVTPQGGLTHQQALERLAELDALAKQIYGETATPEMGQWEQEGAPEGACQRISFQEALKSVLQQRRK